MPKQSRRREAIRRMVQERGFLSVDDLASTFDVTHQTIRRDLNALCKDNAFQRYHGGIGLENRADFRGRRNEEVCRRQSRHAIAALAAAQIPDGASLFIGPGSTACAVAAALAEQRRLRVITNSLEAARCLAGKDTIDLTLAGGSVRSANGYVVGEAAMEMIGQFQVDFAIVGVSAIDGDGSLLHCDRQAALLSQAMMANARQVFLVAEQSKVGRAAAAARLGFIHQVHAWFTDQAPDESLRPLLASHRINVLHPGVAALSAS